MEIDARKRIAADRHRSNLARLPEGWDFDLRTQENTIESSQQKAYTRIGTPVCQDRGQNGRNQQ